MKLAFTKEYSGRRLTGLSWLLMTILILSVFFAGFRNLYSFLAPDAPPHEGLMVVEGWIHDFALDEAVSLYRSGNYSKIICTGVPIETGSYIQQFKSYPEMTAARLRKLGIRPEELIVTVSDDSKKDRTYASAIALREYFMTQPEGENNIHLVTVGPHGRRSRMLFKKVLGQDFNIGVTCLEEMTYSPDDWYQCSQGVRSTLGELIAYSYARFFFHP